MAQDFGQSFSSRLGTAFGTGIGSGLQNIAQQRFLEKQRQAQSSGLQSLLNLSPEKAYGLAQQDPAFQREFLKQQMQAGSGSSGALTQLLTQQGIPQQTAQLIESLDPRERSLVLQNIDALMQQQQAQSQQGGSLPLQQLAQMPGVQAGRQQIQPMSQATTIPQQMQQPQQQQRPSSAGDLFKSPQSLMREQTQLLKEQAQQQKEQAAKASQQRAIDKSNAKYLENLDKRKLAAQDVVKAASEMKAMLDEGDVASGWSGAVLPARMLGSDSERFSNLSDDIANALTGLSTGVQTISKIKFNRERKPNLGQNRETQITRTNDLLNDAARILLEDDVKDYLIERNDGQQPANLSSEVSKIYKTISQIPPVPEEAEDGDIFQDQKTGIKWQVAGPIMRFAGIERKGQ